MKKIAVMNYKGGVGKTTLTANIGAELAARGKHVLLIDLDPQASLTFSFILAEEWRDTFSENCTIKEFFDAYDKKEEVNLINLINQPERIQNYLHGRSTGSLSVIYSHLKLIDIDYELAASLSGATQRQQSERHLRVHTYLSDAISSLDTDGLDYILFDCPPNFGIVTRNAIVASDGIIVPAKPDYLSTLGIEYLKGQLDKLIRDYNYFGKETGQKINVDISGVIFTMVSEMGGGPQSTLRRYMNEVINQDQVPVFEAYMKYNNKFFGTAPEEGLPVVLSRANNSTINSVVDGLKAVTTEFMKRT